MTSKAAEAFNSRLQQGWTQQDWSHRRLWFFPSEQRLWEESGDARADREVIAAHIDAIRVTNSGCPKCLVGYADLMSDPMFTCDLCHGTGFPVFTK